MGPIIILDKSALQSLSFDEIITLHKYYLLNIPPVLTIEILGDLKKPTKNSLSQEKVVELANKLLPFNSAINVHYKDSIAASLLGYPVNMDGRPAIGGGRSILTKEGEKGIIFEETPEEEALLRWRDGKFTEAENILAERWRESTRGVNLEVFKKHLKDVYNAIPKFSSLEELKNFLNEFLLNPLLQVNLLTLLIYEFNLSFNTAQRAFLRWETEGHKIIKDFSRYAFYCLSANLFFEFGLMNNLIGTRTTNRVDLEYIFYFPFCMGFGSNDNFHKTVSPFFLTSRQSFISGEELKLDLRSISDQWNALDEKGKAEWKTKFGVAPPENCESLSSRLWQRHMGSWKHAGDMTSDLSDEQNKRFAEFITKKLEGEIGSPNSKSDFGSDDADFIIKKRTIRIDDLCPCGSGKQFKDCHAKKFA